MFYYFNGTTAPMRFIIKHGDHRMITISDLSVCLWLNREKSI